MSAQPGPEALAQALAEGLSPAEAPSEVVGPVLQELWREARATWPDVPLPAEAFVAHLAQHLPEGDVIEGLIAVRPGDLYLACGCARGLPAALTAFDEVFGGELRAAGRRLRRSVAETDDFIQGCRTKLFAPPRPRIDRYAGTGDLRHWLRVALVRMVIDHQRAARPREQREALGDPQAAVLDVPAPSDDNELAYLKARYGHAFREAFEEAVKALSPEMRNLLRRHYGDGLTVDEIGRLLGVHRATAARRVARARAALNEGTRAVLMDRLALGRSELDSVMRLIESQVHVSVQRLLATPPPPGG